MSSIVQIYVALLDEGVDTWRPVQAEPVSGNIYRIVSQEFDRTCEAWQFEPGELVVCEMRDSSSGRILAATSRTSPT